MNRKYRNLRELIRHVKANRVVYLHVDMIPLAEKIQRCKDVKYTVETETLNFEGGAQVTVTRHVVRYAPEQDKSGVCIISWWDNGERAGQDAQDKYKVLGKVTSKHTGTEYLKIEIAPGKIVYRTTEQVDYTPTTPEVKPTLAIVKVETKAQEAA